MKQQQKKQSKKKSKKIKEKELSLESEKTKPFYPLDSGFFDIKGYFKKLKHSLNRPLALLIHMEMRNGYHNIFYVYPKGETFKYKGGVYKIEDEFKYFNAELNVYCLDYHQDIDIPIQNRINSSAIKRNLLGKGITDIDQAINPKSLEQFIKSEVIQKVMKGQELDAFFRFMKIMIIINVLVAVIHFIVFLQASGILANMNIGF